MAEHEKGFSKASSHSATTAIHNEERTLARIKKIQTGMHTGIPKVRTTLDGDLGLLKTARQRMGRQEAQTLSS